MVTSFRYMGIVILAADDNWPAVVQNLTKARAVWRRMIRILSREGESPRVSIFFFKYFVQSVLIFGAETWVVTPCMGQVLGGFQDQVTGRLTGRPPWRQSDGKWDYTSVEAMGAEAGFETMETYIRRRKNTVAQYISTQLFLGLCEATEINQGGWVGMRWW